MPINYYTASKMILVLMLYRPTTTISIKNYGYLPSKIKITVWKISWNYLPTRANMQYKKLITNVICPRCESVVETMDDLFRECPRCLLRITFPYADYFFGRYGQSEEKEIVDYIRKLVDLGKKL